MKTGHLSLEHLFPDNAPPPVICPLGHVPRTFAVTVKRSGGARVFAARGKRLVAAPPIRSAIDILMVTTTSLAWTVTKSTFLPNPFCYANASSPEAAEFRILYFRPSKCRPCTVPPGAHVPLRPPPLPPPLVKRYIACIDHTDHVCLVRSVH